MTFLFIHQHIQEASGLFVSKKNIHNVLTSQEKHKSNRLELTDKKINSQFDTNKEFNLEVLAVAN